MSDQDVSMAALVRGLVEGGVAHACISPGSRSTPVALALAAEPRIRVWSHVDERAGGFFGLGIARATGAPVLLLCTSGTAAAGFHAAALEAREARLPLVILTADRPAELRDCGAGQTVDQLKLYGSAAKWFFEAAAPEAAASGARFFRSLGARAAATAAAGPPGVVHLNLPLRDPLTADPAAIPSFALEAAVRDPRRAITHHAGRLAPDAGIVESLASAVATIDEGLIVCGEGLEGGDAPEAIADLARRSGYPLVAACATGLRTGRTGREAIIDSYDHLLRAPGFTRAHAPRLVIQFGSLPVSKALRGFIDGDDGAEDGPDAPPSREQTRSRRYVLVDPHGDLRDPHHCATDVLRIDPAMLCAALSDRPGGARESRWLASWQEGNARVREAIQGRLDRLEEPFEGRVARDLAAFWPSGGNLFVGSSMPIRDLESFFPGRAAPLRVLANRGANGIDGVLSSALGVAAVSAAPTALLIGDLSFLHDLGGLLAARRHGIAMTIVIVNNGGGGIFRFLPQRRHEAVFEDLFATSHDLQFGHAAALFGLRHRAVHEAQDFLPALRELSDGGGILEVRTDSKRNVEIHAEIAQAAEEALGRG